MKMGSQNIKSINENLEELKSIKQNVKVLRWLVGIVYIIFLIIFFEYLLEFDLQVNILKLISILVFIRIVLIKNKYQNNIGNLFIVANDLIIGLLVMYFIKIPIVIFILIITISIYAYSMHPLFKKTPKKKDAFLNKGVDKKKAVLITLAIPMLGLSFLSDTDMIFGLFTSYILVLFVEVGNYSYFIYYKDFLKKSEL